MQTRRGSKLKKELEIDIYEQGGKNSGYYTTTPEPFTSKRNLRNKRKRRHTDLIEEDEKEEEDLLCDDERENDGE